MAQKLNSIPSKTASAFAKENAKAAARKKKRIIKICIFSALSVALIVVGIIFIPKLLGGSAATPTSVTTYNVEAITYGDVDTTISGSGTLSPITQQTLTLTPDSLVEIEDESEEEESEESTDEETTDEDTSEDTDEDADEEDEEDNGIPEGSYRLTEKNCISGDTVEEDAALAVFTDSEGVEYEYLAPYELVVLSMTLEVGDDLAKGATIASVMSTEGFTMGIAVDEYDIATVEIGQEVTFTVNALKNDYTGEITAVSYSGSSSGGSTAYQLTATMEYVEGIYPGMTVSAEIVIESSGDGLLVPADAVYTSGDNNYIYLAPSGASEGTEYAEEELDISTLTKVYVETGMSDGSYILIESDELDEGDLIIIAKLTSTLTGSDSDEEGGRGNMGGFGGSGFPGGMGGGGGMDFGDFDFGDFDPGNMPGGMGGFGG